jgi:hypothetical protein
LASYVGMIPREYSSGRRQQLGALSKQGNPFLRFLWCEAAAHAVRRDPDLQRFYRRRGAQTCPVAGRLRSGGRRRHEPDDVLHEKGHDVFAQVQLNWAEFIVALFHFCWKEAPVFTVAAQRQLIGARRK